MTGLVSSGGRWRSGGGGVHIRTEGGHHYYMNGPHKLSVPQRLRGTGTVRRLIRTALLVEEQADG